MGYGLAGREKVRERQRERTNERGERAGVLKRRGETNGQRGKGGGGRGITS